MERANMRSILSHTVLATMIVIVTGCGRTALSPESTAKVAETVNESMIAHEPLCIEAGPFPFRSDEGLTCDRCQDLHAAGFLNRRISDEPGNEYVAYTLTEKGKAVYREKPDPEFLELVRKRFAAANEPAREPDENVLSRPRLCLGTTRFHSIADALAPMSLGSSKNFSVKLVTEAKDTSGQLFDPQVASLGLPIPPRPDAGNPALYPERVWTFTEYPDGTLEPTDLRYGAWVNEE